MQPVVTSAENHPPIPPEQLKRWRRLLASERHAASRYRRIAYGETGEWRELLLGLAERELQHAGRLEDMLRAAGAPVGRFSRIGMRARLVLSAQVSRTARLFRRRLEPSEPVVPSKPSSVPACHSA